MGLAINILLIVAGVQCIAQGQIAEGLAFIAISVFGVEKITKTW